MGEWTSSRELPTNVTRLPPRPDLPVLPGWYTIDQPRNVQAYWNGFEWSRVRRWRGVGWLEDGIGVTGSLGVGSGDADGGVESALAGQLTLVRRTPATGIETLTRPIPLPRTQIPPSPPVDAPPHDPLETTSPAAARPDLASESTIRQFPRSAPASHSHHSAVSSPVEHTINPMAIASLILSVLGLLGIGSVLGIILGCKARVQIRRARGTQGGDRLALAGIVVGICTLAITIVVATLWLISLVNFSSHLAHFELSPSSAS